MSKKRVAHVLFLFLTLNLLLGACTTLPAENPRPGHWAKAEPSRYLENFYRVDEQVYRSAQPSAPGMRELQYKGIKTVLNLRYLQNDAALTQSTNLVTQHLSMLASAISQEQLHQALALIRLAEKPVLVHCRYGSDRTGAVIAAYRIIEQHWTKKEAVREMLWGGYGHHYLLFPDIRKTILNLSINQEKQ